MSKRKYEAAFEQLTMLWQKKVGDSRTIKRIRMPGMIGARHIRYYWCAARDLGDGKASYYVLGRNVLEARAAIKALPHV